MDAMGSGERFRQDRDRWDLGLGNAGRADRLRSHDQGFVDPAWFPPTASRAPDGQNRRPRQIPRRTCDASLSGASAKFAAVADPGLKPRAHATTPPWGEDDQPQPEATRRTGLGGCTT